MAASGAWLIIGVVLVATARAHLGDDFANCVVGGASQDECLDQLMDNLRLVSSTGVPEINVPPLDPLFLERIEFNLVNPLFTVNVTFQESTVKGLSKYEKVYIRKVGRDVIELQITAPEFEGAGRYILTGGGIIDLKTSKGNARTTFFDNTVTGRAQIGNIPSTGKMKIISMELDVRTKKLDMALDCLFPKKKPSTCSRCSGCDACLCPLKGRKYSHLSSGNPTLAETVHKFINDNSEKFVEDFQPQISKQVGAVVQEILDAVLGTIDAAYLLDHE